MSDDTGSQYSDDAHVAAPPPALPEVNYELNVETEVPGTGGMLHKTVLVHGEGTAPMDGSKVAVHYVGTLVSDGSKFDSSRDRDDKFEFTIGKGQVIKGWDAGVATMKTGEKAILKCAPEYAYGAAGSPPKIPADATLQFEVELFWWSKSEDVSATKDRSLMKATSVEGKGYDRADYEAELTVDVASVAVDGPAAAAAVLAEKKGWAVVVGDTTLPAGLEEALKSFIEGETAAIDVAGHLVVDDEEWKTTKGQPARYLVTVAALKSIKPYMFEKAETVSEAEKRKAQGNAYFKAQDWPRAAAKYRRALEFVEHEYGMDDEQKAQAVAVKVAVHNNLAQVELNTHRLAECIDHCGKCLAIEPANAKALFRRGKANAALGEWDSAKADFKAILAADAANTDAAREMAAVDAKLWRHHQKEKAAFGNMFAKMAAMEAAEAKAAPPPPPPADAAEAAVGEEEEGAAVAADEDGKKEEDAAKEEDGKKEEAAAKEEDGKKEEAAAKEEDGKKEESAAKEEDGKKEESAAKDEDAAVEGEVAAVTED